METKTEAVSDDITEHPYDDEPNTGMFSVSDAVIL